MKNPACKVKNSIIMARRAIERKGTEVEIRTETRTTDRLGELERRERSKQRAPEKSI